MSLAKTGYTTTTAKNYLIDAATVYTNVTYEAVAGFTGTLIGATQGGVSFKIEQNFRQAEVDGASHIAVKGNDFLESAAGTIVAKLKEITAENLRKGLNGVIRAAAADEAPTGYQVLETKRALTDTDYLENIAIVGTLSGTTSPVICILDNPLCTGGIELATEDKTEAVVELTFEARADAAQLLVDAMPWRILFPAIA